MVEACTLLYSLGRAKPRKVAMSGAKPCCKAAAACIVCTPTVVPSNRSPHPRNLQAVAQGQGLLRFWIMLAKVVRSTGRWSSVFSKGCRQNVALPPRGREGGGAHGGGKTKKVQT